MGPFSSMHFMRTALIGDGERRRHNSMTLFLCSLRAHMLSCFMSVSNAHGAGTQTKRADQLKTIEGR